MAAYLAIGKTRGKTIRRERRNPLDHPDAVLLAEYHMPKQLITELCDLLRPQLGRSTRRSNALSVEEQVLVSLKILATGRFQDASKDCINVAQSTASTVFNTFLDALGEKSDKFIYPPSDPHAVSEKFYEISGFPGVIGAIDGTDIPIVAPKENDHLYVSGKGFHSVKVQVICDADLIFWNVVAKWPGSTHDSFILERSDIFENFESGHFGDLLLLGDSDYPLKNWLMVPITNTSSSAEDFYNKTHKETRATVQKALGVLKQRWRILDYAGGYLRYAPLKVCKIIVCCMVLHNICRRRHIPLITSLPGTPGEADIASLLAKPGEYNIASLPAQPVEADQETDTASLNPTALIIRRNLVATIAGL